MKGITVKQRGRREGGGREGRRQGKRDRGRAGKHTGTCGVTLEFQVCGQLRGVTRAKEFEASLGNRKSEFP